MPGKNFTGDSIYVVLNIEIIGMNFQGRTLQGTIYRVLNKEMISMNCRGRT